MSTHRSTYRCLHCCDVVVTEGYGSTLLCQGDVNSLIPSTVELDDLPFCATYYLYIREDTVWNGTHLSAGHWAERDLIKDLVKRCRK